ncbi:hypothetical protein JYU34_014035 [Plutella xylostella]|uniref:Integrator complex subunit 14 n=1 Tax=Plutella xylostella TaxID=51655 RepID=A0ABQ7Q7H4_PLUXY|nr:hypothetical protein JYU34_014035 [Plutella xylostella]
MPTVILLDVSLSMFRPVPSSDTTETHTRFTLAAAAINSFLDYLNVHVKLEYVALVTYSSTHDVAVPFTRDFDTIRTKLTHLEEGDKTCLEAALLGINHLVMSEWGSQTLVQTVLITDGSCGVGPLGRNLVIQALPLPPPYPSRVHIIPIASPNEPSLQHAMPLYQKVVELSTNTNHPTMAITRGVIYCPDQLNVPGVVTAASRLCEQQYQETWSTLRCGQLEAKVQLFPPIIPPADSGAPPSRTIHVIGFIPLQDLGTPISISRHLVLPQAQPAAPRDNYADPKTPTKEGSSSSEGAEEDAADPSKQPHFCVLLHGALKVESMGAIVSLGNGWFGSLLARCEARARRSCLQLALGTADAAPWLGPLPQLGPAGNGATETFPVRATRSYSGGGGAAWSRPHALLADVQKVLRHARKLPDKTPHLYKELNRLRRAAISLGFSELLTCVGAALERECASLPPGASQECSIQLAHAANALRDPRTALDIKHTLTPPGTGFSGAPSTH